MKLIIGLFLVAIVIVGGLITAGLIAISIALDEWSKNDKGN